MSLPQHITRGVGGPISISLLTRPTAATVEIEDGAGGTVLSATSATVSSINTTMSAIAVSRGASQFDVAAAAGILSGAELWLQDDPETVLVRRVSGTTVYLRRPMVKDHAASAVVQSTLCSYTVLAAAAASSWWDGRAKWTLNDGSIHFRALECTAYPLRRYATLQHVYDRQASLFEILQPTEDTERKLDLAHDHVLQKIGAAARCRVFTGGPEFIDATVLAFLAMLYEGTPTDEATRLYERYSALLEAEIGQVTSTTPRDTNQNGVIEEAERMSFRSVPLRRA